MKIYSNIKKLNLFSKFLEPNSLQNYNGIYNFFSEIQCKI